MYMYILHTYSNKSRNVTTSKNKNISAKYTYLYPLFSVYHTTT